MFPLGRVAALDEVTTFNTSSTSTSSLKPFDAKETTRNTVEISSSSSTSTSSDRRLDELANMLELLTPFASQIESIENATERASMLTKRMMETPLPEPPMVEPDRTSAKRRLRTRYTPLPGIMENAVYLAPSAWPPVRHA